MSWPTLAAEAIFMFAGSMLIYAAYRRIAARLIDRAIDWLEQREMRKDGPAKGCYAPNPTRPRVDILEESDNWDESTKAQQDEFLSFSNAAKPDMVRPHNDAIPEPTDFVRLAGDLLEDGALPEDVDAALDDIMSGRPPGNREMGRLIAKHSADRMSQSDERPIFINLKRNIESCQSQLGGALVEPMRKVARDAESEDDMGEVPPKRRMPHPGWSAEDASRAMELMAGFGQRVGTHEECLCGTEHNVTGAEHGDLIECGCGLAWVVVEHDGLTLEAFDEVEVIGR